MTKKPSPNASTSSTKQRRPTKSGGPFAVFRVALYRPGFPFRLEGRYPCDRCRHDDADVLFDATRELRMEGIVAKRVDAPYRPGVRFSSWIKKKHHRFTRMT